MRSTKTLALRSAAVTGALLLTGMLTAHGASAASYTYNAPDNATRDVYVANIGTMHLSTVIDSSHIQSQATMVSTFGGVNSRANCQRANGGTAWYQSSIRSTYQGGSSHYDCDNNGTYNTAIVANGGYMS